MTTPPSYRFSQDVVFTSRADALVVRGGARGPGAAQIFSTFYVREPADTSTHAFSGEYRGNFAYSWPYSFVFFSAYPSVCVTVFVCAYGWGMWLLARDF